MTRRGRTAGNFPRLVVTAEMLEASRAQPGAFVAIDDPLFEVARAAAVRRLTLTVGNLRRPPGTRPAP